MKIKGRILSLRSQSFLGEYEQFCVDHCGIVKASVVRNRLYLRRFLAWLERKEKKVEDLDAELVQSYLASVLWRKSRTVKKSILYTVRVFLRFLHLKGYLQRPLDTAVPKIAIYKHSGVPHFLRKDEIDRLLRAPDRSTESGRRDFAMLLLMARYGARLLSVKQLKVADIDWRGKCILFQSSKVART